MITGRFGGSHGGPDFHFQPVAGEVTNFFYLNERYIVVTKRTPLADITHLPIQLVFPRTLAAHPAGPVFYHYSRRRALWMRAVELDKDQWVIDASKEADDPIPLINSQMIQLAPGEEVTGVVPMSKRENGLEDAPALIVISADRTRIRVFDESQEFFQWQSESPILSAAIDHTWNRHLAIITESGAIVIYSLLRNEMVINLQMNR